MRRLNAGLGAITRLVKLPAIDCVYSGLMFVMLFESGATWYCCPVMRSGANRFMYGWYRYRFGKFAAVGTL